MGIGLDRGTQPWCSLVMESRAPWPSSAMDLRWPVLTAESGTDRARAHVGLRLEPLSREVAGDRPKLDQATTDLGLGSSASLDVSHVFPPSVVPDLCPMIFGHPLSRRPPETPSALQSWHDQSSEVRGRGGWGLRQRVRCHPCGEPPDEPGEPPTDSDS